MRPHAYGVFLPKYQLQGLGMGAHRPLSADMATGSRGGFGP